MRGSARRADFTMPAPRILVVRLSSMGDVIHALAAVASLKHSFPQSRISWVIRTRWAPLLEGNPFVDEVIPFERNASGIAALWRKLRPSPKKDRFDVAGDFQGLNQSGLIAAAARPEKNEGLGGSPGGHPAPSLVYSDAVATRNAH